MLLAGWLAGLAYDLFKEMNDICVFRGQTRKPIPFTFQLGSKVSPQREMRQSLFETAIVIKEQMEVNKNKNTINKRTSTTKAPKLLTMQYRHLSANHFIY